MENKINNIRLRKTVCNKGFIGIGNFKATETSKDFKIYVIWRGIIQRCYSKTAYIKSPTYINCTICEEWLNYQVFAKWFEENYIKGYHLDKDILFKGNKLYSPETCCFVPSCINNLFTKANIIRGLLPIGVSKAKKVNQYQAIIYINNKQKFLGYFDEPLDAFNAYKVAKEAEIKSKAEQYKDSININCYLALINYTIQIND